MAKVIEMMQRFTKVKLSASRSFMNFGKSSVFPKASCDQILRRWGTTDLLASFGGCDNNEMCFRISVSEIYFKDLALEKLCFKTSTGLSGTYLASDFQDEDETQKTKH